MMRAEGIKGIDPVRLVRLRLMGRGIASCLLARGLAFRWMNLTGIPPYALVMEGLLPKFSTAGVPTLMRDMVARGGTGVGNASGIYTYTKSAAPQWEQAWVGFTYDMRR